MNDTLSIDTLTIQLPKSDLSFLKTLSKKLGWKLLKGDSKEMSELEQSLDDVRHGRVTEYTSAQEFYDKMGI